MPQRFFTATAPLTLVLLAAAILGCNGETSKPAAPAAVEDNGGAATQTASHATSAATEGEITMGEIDKPGLDEAIAGHAGKAVLVDFWATWCGPCKEQFPHTVEMSHRYRDQGLAVISVSCDTLDEKEAALAFLKRVGADIENYISTAGFDSLELFDIQALPHYRIYDRQGKLLKSSGADPDDILSPDDIEELVKQALATAP